MAEGDAAAVAAAAAASAAAAAASKPWYQGVADAETLGHWQNNGWDKKTAAEVAVEATKSWKNAEKFVGAPANEILRVPKDASDEAGWKNVWSRLGKPAEAKDYDLSAVKGADGNALDENFANFVREQAFNLNLPKDAGAALAQRFAKYMDDGKAAASVEVAAKLATEKTELAKNWGANFEANKFVATQAAKALGVDPETVAALEKQVGYAKVMEMFRNIGSKIGEDKFVTSQAPGGNGVMTRDQAQARKSELMKDQAWVKSYLAGDAAKAREMTALNTLLVS